MGLRKLTGYVYIIYTENRNRLDQMVLYATSKDEAEEVLRMKIHRRFPTMRGLTYELQGRVR